MITPTLHSPVARILVLDDEEVQRWTVHRQLKGLGECIDFGDPDAAIEYLKANQVDVCVVDIRMPTNRHDGLWFLTTLREFDPITAIVVRTADDTMPTALTALRARATQIVNKSDPEAKAILRDYVERAIKETTEARTIRADAEKTRETEHALVDALARTDDQLTVAALCRGFILTLTDQIAAISGYGQLLKQMAESPNSRDELMKVILSNEATATKLATTLQNFLTDPYSETAQSGLTAPTANKAIRALKTACEASPIVTGRELKVSFKEMLPDMVLSSPGSQVLTSMRHLMEYCALNTLKGGGLTVQCSFCESLSDAEIQKLLLGRRSISSQTALISFLFSGEISVTQDQLFSDLRKCAVEPRNANLWILAAIGADEHFGLRYRQFSHRFAEITLYIPVQR